MFYDKSKNLPIAGLRVPDSSANVTDGVKLSPPLSLLFLFTAGNVL